MEKEVIKKTIISFIKSRAFLKTAISSLIGGLAGFLYYYFIGCTSGHCPITSNPYMSIMFGAVFGFILGFDPVKKNKQDQLNK